MVWSALGWTFDLRSSEPSVEDQVSEVLAPLRCHGGPVTSHYRIDRSDAGPATLDLWLDGTFVGSSPDLPTAAGLVLWSINQQVNVRSGHAVLVHAAAAALDGRAVVLPGASGSGKSTLVTALVTAGFGYLTDEAAAFRLEDGSIEPYHRPISLKRGSWSLFPDLEPAMRPTDAISSPDQWHIDPRVLREGEALCRGAEPRVVMIPDLDRGGPVRAEPISDGEALRALADTALNLEALGQRGLDALADVVRQCRSYRLSFDDPAGAVATIRAALVEERSTR